MCVLKRKKKNKKPKIKNMDAVWVDVKHQK